MDEDWLRELEESLLRPETRGNVEALSRLLAPDFHEKGASGQTYDRDATLATLPIEASPQNFVISDFIATELDIYVAMLDYRLAAQYAGEDAPRRSVRKSLWRLAEGGWQIFFHQDEPLAE